MPKMRCQRCTRRHISCDRNQPCGACVKSNSECTWDTKNTTFLFYSENTYVKGEPRVRGPRARKTDDMSASITSDGLSAAAQREALCEKAMTHYVQRHDWYPKSTITHLGIEDFFMMHKDKLTGFPTLGDCMRAISLASYGHAENVPDAIEASWFWYQRVVTNIRIAISRIEQQEPNAMLVAVMMLGRLEDKLGLCTGDTPRSLNHDAGALAMMSRTDPNGEIGAGIRLLLMWRVIHISLIRNRSVPAEARTVSCSPLQQRLRDFCIAVADKQSGAYVDCTELDRRALDALKNSKEHASEEREVVLPALPMLNGYRQRWYMNVRAAWEWNIYRTARIRMQDHIFQNERRDGGSGFLHAYREVNRLAIEMLMSIAFHFSKCDLQSNPGRSRNVSHVGKLVFALLAVLQSVAADQMHKDVARAALTCVLQMTGNIALCKLTMHLGLLRGHEDYYQHIVAISNSPSSQSPSRQELTWTAAGTVESSSSSST